MGYSMDYVKEQNRKYIENIKINYCDKIETLIKVYNNLLKNKMQTTETKIELLNAIIEYANCEDSYNSKEFRKIKNDIVKLYDKCLGNSELIIYKNKETNLIEGIADAQGHMLLAGYHINTFPSSEEIVNELGRDTNYVENSTMLIMKKISPSGFCAVDDGIYYLPVGNKIFIGKCKAAIRSNKILLGNIFEISSEYICRVYGESNLESISYLTEEERKNGVFNRITPDAVVVVDDAKREGSYGRVAHKLYEAYRTEVKVPDKIFDLDEEIKLFKSGKFGKKITSINHKSLLQSAAEKAKKLFENKKGK